MMRCRLDAGLRWAWTLCVAGCAAMAGLPGSGWTAADSKGPSKGLITESALITNSLGMVMVRIPAGTFIMGEQPSTKPWAQTFPGLEADRFESLTDERPAHRVRITRDF